MPGNKRRRDTGNQSTTGIEVQKKPRLGPFKWTIAPKRNTTPDTPLYISTPRDGLLLLERKDIQRFLNQPTCWTSDLLLEWAISCWFCNECLPYSTDRRVAVGSTDWWIWIHEIGCKPTESRPAAKAAKDLPVSTAAKVDPENHKPLRLALKVARNIDLFTRHFVVLPINIKHNHWVLALLVNIGQVVREEKAEPPRGLKPMLLIADSLSVDTTSIQYHVELWISHCARALAPGRKTKAFPTYRLECPQQSNSYDCGFYLVHFLHCIWRHLDLLMDTVPKRLDPELYQDVWRPDQALLSREVWKDALKLSLELEKSRKEI